MDGWMRPEQEQMAQYAEAFYGLAALFQRLPCQKERLSEEELRVLFEDVKERVCVKCQKEETCWGDAYFSNCRMLYDCLREMEQSGTFSPEQEQYLRKNCGRSGQMSLALRAGYEEARNQLLWSNRMLEQRQAAGEQIYQTAELLRQTAQSFAGAAGAEQRVAKKLRRELQYLNVELDDIRAFARETDKTEYYLTAHAVNRSIWSGGALWKDYPVLRLGKRTQVVSARSVAEALSESCGEKMCPAPDCRAGVTDVPMIFHFVPETNYQLFCGVARVTKTGEMVSGDNYTLLQKDNGKILMSLADGMGSGTEANRESEKVIELLEQFLEAGFPQETAVRLINSCMLLQNGSQMFSTIDLCMVDLYNAKCDMIKFGAAATFLIDEKEIEVIRSGALPPGVMQQSDYESLHRTLKSGESIVMMTDGVSDALPEENREQAMAELIIRTKTRNAQEYARRLMERVYLSQKRQARDDMTILIGTIFEKK
ncbi:MAG: SpoIIE family protein phosphatase [Lachnospiraceae bacterium]|nr:SpoIIE family protein phosphatase [Lachnospiraceae bacterium]